MYFVLHPYLFCISLCFGISSTYQMSRLTGYFALSHHCKPIMCLQYARLNMCDNIASQLIKQVISFESSSLLDASVISICSFQFYFTKFILKEIYLHLQTSLETILPTKSTADTDEIQLLHDFVKQPTFT